MEETEEIPESIENGAVQNYLDGAAPMPDDITDEIPTQEDDKQMDGMNHFEDGEIDI
jgi:hypothetical protein